ncbi:hypothetical protein BEWA_030280 [Theileria equi strain WA]|uniref:Uncharacterized protein n=1 Tax=Theileria equi strain WA TaxID=1537102 RepID=L0AX85_THEEQ|nr:hypothetical protein BEWA_030280 [Theileria equi strain WA]AFZ80175.1 hypothetical protein BEWA_030280 [Theileria equi strain WA]|eukprot:XP_004829841.1 hypothetical protein BEWA_030280 [Theileria equi strain WA]
MPSGVTIEIDIDKKESYTNVTLATDNKPTTKDGTVLYGYCKRIYTVDKKYKIENIKKGHSELNGFNDLNLYSNVSIYYWTTKDNQIFIIQLGEDDYYDTNGGTEWNKYSYTTSHAFINDLDEWNCLLNSIHVADISQKSSNPRSSYNCPSCGSYSHRTIRINRNASKEHTHQYVRYNHEIEEGQFGTVRNDKHTILSVPEGVNSLYVYWSTGTSATRRILCYSNKGSYKWYSKYLGDTEWTEESALTQDPDTLETTPEKIQQVIQGFSTPNVIIDLKQETADSYTPKNNVLNFKVEVTGNPSQSGYYEYKHSMVGEGTFKVKSVVHGGNILDGIKSEIISSISGFYLGAEQKYDNLLIVKLTSGTEEKYYKNPHGSNWNIDNFIHQPNLLTHLDLQNCKRNNAHVPDISKAGSTTYPCYACEDSGQTVTFSASSNEVDGKYKKVVHTISSAGSNKIGAIDNSNKRQFGIKITSSVTSLTAFHYPPNNGRPLLIYLPGLSTSWYRRQDKNSNRWEEIENNAPESDNDGAKILKLLKKINGDKEGPSGGEIAGYSTAGVMTPLATAEAVNYTLDTGWSIIRRVMAIFNAAI